jgi:hypothetical protein
MDKNKWLYQLMGQIERQPPASADDLGIEPEDSDPDQYMRLKIKKKRQNHMIKQMLEDGGYKELARMTTISGAKPSYSDEESY